MEEIPDEEYIERGKKLIEKLNYYIEDERKATDDYLNLRLELEKFDKILYALWEKTIIGIASDEGYHESKFKILRDMILKRLEEGRH